MFKLISTGKVAYKMRLVKYLPIILLTCLIISCGLVKTAYNNAPALVAWRLDNYFNFTQAQNITLKPSLVRLHNWHRKNQLPHYVTQLQDMQVSLENEQISASQACEKIETIKLNIHRLQLESIPIIIEMAPLLSDKQLVYFQKELVEHAEKWKLDWWQETAAEQLNARLEKSQEFAEQVYGNLNEVQINLLKQSITEMAINPAISYKEIQRRNDDALQILGELQKPLLSFDEKSLLIKAGFERVHKSPNQAYQSYADKLANDTCATIANLHASTNAQQKSHAKNWLGGYITQLTALQTK